MMHWRLFVALFFLAGVMLGGVVMADGRPLDSLRWQSRVVVVLASAPDEAMLDEQLRLLDEVSAGLRERDVVVITARDGAVTIDGVERPALDAGQLRATHGTPSSGFQVLLIGKDGGVKLRSTEPVSAEELFALIDTMPMRRREMRERPTG